MNQALTSSAAPISKPKKKRSNRARRETMWFYAFISPWMIGFICLSVFPMLFGLMISFTNYNGFNLNHLKFLGFGNYTRAFGDPDVLQGITRSVVFATMNVIFSITLSFFVAMLLNLRVYARGFFRAAFYIPSIVPIVAVAWIWKMMFDKNTGLINAIISVFSPGTAPGWLVDYPTQTLVMMTLWISVGGAMIILLAGLQGVPKELEEAAMIDGANFFQMFRAITLPLMTPVIFYQLVISIIFSLQVLQEPMLLGGGTSVGGLGTMPPVQNYMYMVNAYFQIFISQRFGYGSALLWLLFGVILILTLLVFGSSRYWVYYETPQEGGEK